MDSIGNSSQANDVQTSSDSNINNNNSLITNNNIPWKQRKRKRLSAVLDKLHHNNNNSNVSDNNQLSESRVSTDGHQMQMAIADQMRLADDEDDDRTTIASDDMPSSAAGSPVVKHEQFGSPVHFGVNDENMFRSEQIKQEGRLADFGGSRNENDPNAVDQFLSQMPLFEYYLQTKYLPEILRMRNTIAQAPPQAKPLAPLPLELQAQSLQYLQQHQQHQQQGLGRQDAKPAARQPPRKRQRQSKQHDAFPVITAESQPPQDAPLDLSMKTIGKRARAGHDGHATPQRRGQPPQARLQPAEFASVQMPNFANILANVGQLGKYPFPAAASNVPQVPIVKGDIASPTTKESVAFHYNLDVSPVVEEMQPGNDVAYVCPICGQMFSLHDRLAKHMASRHKSKSSSSEITKSYVCEVCDRSFARSDMLTRHMRLHTGIKPYTCKVCSQVFSRSDHLSTHQRTHTGEKPYKCPQCPYAACRRDMITRHMRTHARYEAQRAAAAAAAALSDGLPIGALTRPAFSPPVPIKLEHGSGHSTPRSSPGAHDAHDAHRHSPLNNNSRTNKPILMNHHILSHQADDLIAPAIIKTENTLLTIQ